ncbi:20134_t:CDS:2 [Funneliformis geosporum]|nr:20134_t:CDS:2 [Funneliformis geosporum]
MIELSSLVAYFVLAFIGLFTYKVYIFPYYISPLRKIPGPPSENLLYGNLKTLFVEESGEPHKRWVKKYGNFIKYYGFLNKPTIVVTDAKIIKDIFLTQGYDFVKSNVIRGDIIRIVGKGISTVEGETHKRQRKMMNPAFAHNNIKNMVPTFSRLAFKLKCLIEDDVNKGESKINFIPYISKTTLDIIGLVGFNHEFNASTSPSELAEAYDHLMGKELTKLSIIISLLSVYLPVIRKIPIDINKRFNNAFNVIERESKKLIEERYHNDENSGNDLLSLLININKTLPNDEKMTKDELRYQIMTFLLTGHETTSITTSWALYFLAQHPHEQDLLREELVKAFPDKSKFNPTFDEINSLDCLNSVVKETLRLLPPAATIYRLSIKDKNTIIDIPIATIHRLPSVWGSTADIFYPKRWLDPSMIKDVSNYNYLPFGVGIRACIGYKLSITEFKILLSVLVRNFIFQPVEGLNIKKRPGVNLSRPDPYLELIISNVKV